MAQWILKANGNIVPRRSSRPLTVGEIHSAENISKPKTFDGLIERRHGTSINPPIESDEDTTNEWEEYEDDDEPARTSPDIEDTVDANGRLLKHQPAYDEILHAEVSLQKGEDMAVERVTNRAIGPDGGVAGAYDDNPYLITMIYEVEFPDGELKEYAANVIAENMLTQVDSENSSMTLMRAIIDSR
jgi:hypothetical protein